MRCERRKCPTVQCKNEAAPDRKYYAGHTDYGNGKVKKFYYHYCYPCLEEKGEVVTFVAEKKTGRNEPCHCGSKKKYKKCHGR